MRRKKDSTKKQNVMDEELRNNSEANHNGAENQSNTASDNNDTDSLKQQLEEMKDKYMRLFAEFENYKRRTLKEKADWFKTAAEDTMSALLPILDDFDRARKFAEENDNEGWSEGMELLYQKLYSVLKSKGLEPMQSNGEEFDPEIHNAITEIPAPDEEMKGKVVDTVEKGYRLNDKIIRHAKVVVGK
ncbi:MAG: nucleotide exchange factor GrpE [Bacteroidetes bacterium]|nr:MAG: nucleotide exchange factor GrpE [Bacteroidota bacterium]